MAAPKAKSKRDACYYKVKRAYTKNGGTWPSAYASGALVKCRKVGAANWGKKSGKKTVLKYSEFGNLGYVEKQVAKTKCQKENKLAKNNNSDFGNLRYVEEEKNTHLSPGRC